ncbi:MAG: OsmC family protein [Pseudomonadota bacterium]
MALGENMIAIGDAPPFFRADPASGHGLTPPALRGDEAIRCAVRALSGFQKEALVTSARTGATWRLVSDEGAYLSGHDAAPCPLGFFTCGMIASYFDEITRHAAARGVTLRALRLTQNNVYTMQGSMRQRTMVGGARPIALDVAVECDLSDHALRELVETAVAASPVSGLVKGVLPSLFTLTHNSTEIATGAATSLGASAHPEVAAHAPRPAPGDLALVERMGLSPEKVVPKGTEAPASSLADAQDRTLNPAATAFRREDGLIEIEQVLYSPRGSVFRFLSEEAPMASGPARAPDALSLLAAGIGFCFMTQFGRMAVMEKRALSHYAVVQDLHVTHGTAGRPGTADPVETHVHLHMAEGAEVAREMLDVAERTCFLHALCRTDLHTEISLTRL